MTGGTVAYTHEDLDLANQQIRHAETLIEHQQRIIDRLAEVGQSTRLADKLMSKMQAGLAARRRHRDDIETHLEIAAVEQPVPLENSDDVSDDSDR
jgi:predicted metal-dependent hydrolase